MLRHTILTATLAAAVLSASALDISCTPGALADLAGTQAADVTTLRLTGQVNANDLLYIGKSMPKLTVLDLSGVTISATNGSAGKYAAATIPSGAFAGSSLTSVSLPQNITVGDCAFADTHLTGLILPAGTTVNAGAFGACSILATVAVGDRCVLGDRAFAGCKELKTVSLGNGITFSGSGAFSSCPSLATVNGSDGLAAIAHETFADDGSLDTFAFGKKLTAVGNGAFRHTSLGSADLGNTSLTSLGEWAFANCSYLTSVVLPPSCAAIGAAAFFDCPELSSANIPESCTTIPPYAFKDASVLGTLPLAETNTAEIGAYSLKGTDLTDITLPSSLQTIGNNAMEGISNLSRIDGTRLREVPQLGSDVWTGVRQSEVNLDVDKELASQFEAAPQWQDFKINAIDTQVSDLPISVLKADVRAAYTDHALLIESLGSDIASVDVFDVAGMLVSRTAHAADRVTIAADRLPRIIAVSVTLADGTSATVKLAR